MERQLPLMSFNHEGKSAMKIDIGRRSTASPNAPQPQSSLYAGSSSHCDLRGGEGCGDDVIARCSGRPTFPRKLSNFPMSRIINLSRTRTLPSALSRFSSSNTCSAVGCAPPSLPPARSSVKLSECSLTARETSNVLRRAEGQEQEMSILIQAAIF